MVTDIKAAAEREVNRIREIISNVKVVKTASPRSVFSGEDLLDFARNYASDSNHFFEKKDFVEAFEAAIIAWAYIDIGFKLDLLDIPKYLHKHFTK